MKKSVRPTASKVSADRGKAEAANATATVKPASKGNAAAPLSKVRLVKINTLDLICLFVLFHG